ncbi:MAG: asparagine synthase (glutamine-hydrolyzing) [Bacteroidales bacterium]|nr:asparagine synthase (glutamine-hydrolyzing) [Bacteroidales bacterium]
MCGICGFYDSIDDGDSLLSSMLDLLAHRGPDEARRFRHGNFYLGHRRLSIIDLNTGSQPIFNETRSIAVIFNGEIYNFADLRKELIRKNHVFYTKTDTEILVHLYEDEGISFLSRLNGIFAFALLDLKENKLILARDHFGVKPLHYYFDGKRFIFASEQKAILLHPAVPRKINFCALHQQINLRYHQSNETLFEGIYRLPPAHYLVFNGSDIELKKYWCLSPHINIHLLEEEAVDGIHFYIRQAVSRQLISDVPLGVYLSGGMDSSTIVQKMYELGVSDIHTFTLGFNEPTDEFTDAEIVARHFQTQHHTLTLELEPLTKFPAVIWHAEEPKINLLQGYHLSEFVRQYITVALGGLGGDELFGGYDIHRYIYPLRKLHKTIPKWMQRLGRWKSDFLFKLQQYPGWIKLDEYRRGIQMLLATGQIERTYLILRNAWDYDEAYFDTIYHPSVSFRLKSEIKRIREEFAPLFNLAENFDPLDQVFFVEFHSKMVNDYLLTEDRMSMAHGVEERVPFLDIDLVNFAFSIPVHLKMKGNQTKYLFRKAMEGHLPEPILRKKKWGFTVNPYLQFQKDLKNVAEKILTPSFVDQQGIFNYAFIQKILHARPSPRLRWHYNFLWILVGIAIWQEMFIRTDRFKEKEFNLETYFHL